MGLPTKSIKHVARHQEPIGTQKKLKIKIKDGDTGKVSWRSGKKGFLRDFDGDPISTVYANRDMAISHKVRMGSKSKASGKTPRSNEMPDDPSDSE
jgi:hypothetical protein